MGRLGDDIYRLRREIAQWQDSRNTMVEELKDNHQCIQHDVAEMQANCRREHQSQAASLRKELHDHRSHITVAVEKMRKSNARWRERMPDLSGYWRNKRSEIQDRLAKTAHQGASERAAYVAGIRQHVSTLQHTFAQFRKTVNQDLDDLRRAWHGSDIQTAPASSEDIPAVTVADTAMDPAGGISEASEPEPAEPELTEPDAVESVAVEPNASEPDREADLPSEGQAVFTFAGDADSEALENGTADDLTMIAGIGPERQKKLNAADIFTFETLSRQSADMLHAKLDTSVKREEVQHWIDQARELTRLG